jgi:hypothetical protein
MSRLDGEVELQTRSLKMDVRFEIPLGLDQMISVRSNDGSTDLGTFPRRTTVSLGWRNRETRRCLTLRPVPDEGLLPGTALCRSLNR